jgi:hypothetical protein
MPAWQISKGVIMAKRLRLGSAGFVNVATALTGTQAIDPASISAGAIGSITITATGVLATDLVQIEAPATLSAGLVVQGFAVTADTITVKLMNTTASPIDDTSKTWTWKAVRIVTP